MFTLSSNLKIQISTAVAAARSETPINVLQIAQQLQLRNPNENVAFEDILASVLVSAQMTGEPIMFERATFVEDYDNGFAPCARKGESC